MKQIETPRLLLRPFKLDDASAMFSNWANDPEVTKYMTWNPHQNEEVTKAIIKMWLKEEGDPKCYRFAITEKGKDEVIGSIDVVDYIDGCPEIGYCLSRKHWNKGYMSEAASSFVAYLFKQGFAKIVIEANVDNIGSNRVIEKVGFTFTHLEHKEHCSSFKPEPIDVNWYELRNEIMDIKYQKAVLDEPTIARLIELSDIWAKENITFGYGKNGKEDIHEPCFLAIKDHQIIGYAFGHYYRAKEKRGYIEKGDERFDVDEIFVLPEYRSLGIGKRLFSLLEEEARTKVKYLSLPTGTKDYKKILHFYVEEVGMDFHSAFLMKKL